MKTYQLKFLAWTFSAFLPPDDEEREEIDYYELLDVSKNANADDIKKAYRKRSLQLHPDKLRQRGMKYQGKVITEDEARAQFQQMKAAYDTLSDPKKRQIYDALGHRGMDFVINPSHAYDPHVLMGNLAKSSVFDRAKLMALVLMFFSLVLLQPILICAKVDQMLEKNGGALENSSWLAIFIPFWFFAIFYGVLLVIGKAVLPLMHWVSFVVGILFLALKFDNLVSWDYAIVFIPFYFWMFLRFVEGRRDMTAVQADMSRMVTIEFIEKYVINEKKQDEDGNDIENQDLHRTYNDLNEEERDDINKEYIIVHVPPKQTAPGVVEDEDEEDDFERIERSPEYQEAKIRYEHASKAMSRVVIPEIPLLVLIIVQLDQNKTWNWGLTFLPLWISMFFDCCGGCYHFFCTSALAHIEVQEAMEEEMAKQQEAKNEAKKNDDEEGKNNDVEAKTEEDAKSSTDADANAAKTEEIAESKADAIGVTPVGSDRKEQIEKEVAKCQEMKVGDLKKELESYGMSTTIYFEKSEFVQAVAEARVDGKTCIDTGVSVNAATEGDTKDEDGEDDDEFVFEMDEDTFHFYQQAEMEAENKASEAQAKAIGSFCNIIFQAMIAALFVAKLNKVYEEREDGDFEGTSSYSTFWILFPFLLISGCIISCFACAIFGADGLDSALNAEGGEEEAPDAEEAGETAGAATADDNEASPVILTPQPPSQPVEDLAQNKTEETEAQTANTIDGTGNGDAPAEVADTDLESGMDDLD